MTYYRVHEISKNDYIKKYDDYIIIENDFKTAIDKYKRAVNCAIELNKINHILQQHTIHQVLIDKITADTTEQAKNYNGTNIKIITGYNY